MATGHFYFTKHTEYEPYLGGEMLHDVAVLFDMNSKMDYADNGRSARHSGGPRPPHVNAVTGAVRALKERHIPYTVIACRNIKNAAGKYRVIVLPDALRLSDQAAADRSSPTRLTHTRLR